MARWPWVALTQVEMLSWGSVRRADRFVALPGGGSRWLGRGAMRGWGAGVHDVTVATADGRWSVLMGGFEISP